MKKILLLLLPVIVIASSCRFVAGKRVRGNGNLQTEDRSVSSFEGVDSYGSFDIYVAVASQSAVKIEAEENILPLIETYVDGNVLKVKTKQGFNLNPQRSVKIFVSAPTYNRIHSYGSGNIFGETKISSASKLDLGVTGSADIKLEVDAPEVEAEISGSGNIVLNGQAKKFNTQVAGSGDIRAMNLMTEETSVRIMGSGNADVYASVKLDVNVAGSGDVKYKGGAQVNSHIAGSGNVRKVD